MNRDIGLDDIINMGIQRKNEEKTKGVENLLGGEHSMVHLSGDQVIEDVNGLNLEQQTGQPKT